MSESFPVFVEARRPDGTTDRVRVGTATRAADGFVLRMGDLAIGGTADPARAAAPARAPSSSSSMSSGGGGGGGMVFPPYGRSKSQPISGASMQDLEYYAAGCRRTLADQGKARWHDKERVLLAAIEAEMARQGGGGGDMGGGGGGGGGRGDEPPPLTDDDIPF